MALASQQPSYASQYEQIIKNHSLQIPTANGVAHVFSPINTPASSLDFDALDDLVSHDIISSYRYIDCEPTLAFIATR